MSRHARTARLAVALLALATLAAAPRKQLIEFGWDEPDTRFLRTQIAQFQASPFDGCVYHATYRGAAPADTGNFAWALWGRRRFTAAELASARADLAATRFGRFSANFLRVNVTPAGLDWFEDHSAVMANLELAAGLAKASRGPGILFDIEPYQAYLWDYREQQKHGARPWPEVAARVRALGREAMRALERGYPGLTVFLTIGYTLPLHETAGGLRPLEGIPNGLLVPFLDGLFEAASPRVVIVDGQAHAYPFRDPAQFAAKADSMRHGVRRLLAAPGRYDRHHSSAFGIWLDNDWRTNGWDERDPSRNYFTPEGFATSVRAALTHADRYVWIYSEQPRWWSASGHPLRLPAAYDSVLRALPR